MRLMISSRRRPSFPLCRGHLGHLDFADIWLQHRRRRLGQHVHYQLVANAAISDVSRGHGGRGDDLGVWVDRDVPFVPVETTSGRLVTVTSFRIHRRYHAILGHAPSDPKHPVVSLLQILPDHRRHELGRLRDLGRQRAPVECSQDRVRITGQRVHKCLACGHVVPIARRFSGCDVIVVALAARAQLRAEVLVDDPKQRADRRPDQRHRVLRRHRVVKRCRVQHPLATDEPGRPRHFQPCLEDPIRAR